MKVLGFIGIHYGVEYLEACLKSVVNHVDMMVVAYSKNPSHGVGCNEKCPDDESEIIKICQNVLGGKLIYISRDSFSNEGEHRNMRYAYSNGYDLILTIDADEVYKEDELPNALNYAYTNKERYYGINGYVNFWRSFDFACYDGFRPIRIENLNVSNQLQNLSCPLTVYHFSTCQSQYMMRYKYRVFGHATEVRPQWLDNIYYKWTPENNFGDLHVVAIGLWNATSFDKTTLPSYLKEHVNYNKHLV